jgi:hypothetical protein
MITNVVTKHEVISNGCKESAIVIGNAFSSLTAAGTAEVNSGKF